MASILTTDKRLRDFRQAPGLSRASNNAPLAPGGPFKLNWPQSKSLEEAMSHAVPRSGSRTITGHEVRKAPVRGLAKQAKILVQIGLIAVPLAVICLQAGFPQLIDEFVLSRAPLAVYRLAIIIWFASWVIGAPFDVNIQEEVYASDSVGNGIVSWSLIGSVIAFVLFAIAFLNIYPLEGYFQISLILFVSANWFFLMKLLNPRSLTAIEDSIRTLRTDADWIGFERVEAVRRYLMGAWQTRRFSVMLGLAILQAIVAMTWRLTDIESLVATLNIAGIDGEKIAPFAPAMLFFLFVLIAEIWIWRHRLDLRATLDALQQLGATYTLTVATVIAAESAPAKPETPKRRAARPKPRKRPDA